MFCYALVSLLAIASMANAAFNASICSSTEFQSLSGTRLGDSPIFIRSLVQGDEVCIEYELEASVASQATWFAVGPSPDRYMVNSPVSSVMMFFKDTGKPTSYLLAGYDNSDVTEETDHSAFTVGSANASSMSFSYQRTLAAASSSEVALSTTTASAFIWAYGTSWPISSHKTGTNGAATFNVATAATASGPSTVSSSISSSTSFCDDKNCPGIIGAVAFIIMAICGLLLTTVLKNTPVGTILLHRTVAAPPVKLTTNAAVAKPHTMFLQLLADLHLGELLVILIFVAAIVVLIAMVNNQGDIVVSGQVSLLILMFLILPVSRLPLWSVLFGSSFERIVKFHRWLAVILNIAVIIHAVKAHKMVDFTYSDKFGEVTPLAGFIAFICFLLLLLLSNEYIRRHFFEVFYFTHRVLSIVGFVFTIFHAPTFIGYALCVPLALYGLGLLLRWSSAISRYSVSATTHASSNSTTLILEPNEKVAKMVKNLNPGSYYMVRLPAVSSTQWHPFSSILTPDGKSLGFCVKAMGNGSFTSKLFEKAGTKYQLSANLCGPFGKMSLNVNRYDAVILVAGGVGITPMLSLINQVRSCSGNHEKVLKTADWSVIWSVRNPEDIMMVEKFMPSYLDNAVNGGIQDPNIPILENGAQGTAPTPVNVNWVFHVSSAHSNGFVTRANGESLSYRGGKVVLDEHINTSRFSGRKVAVVACGPPTMTVEAQALARDCNFDFHKEVFNW